MTPVRELLLGTKNRHKIEEITTILHGVPFVIKTAFDVPGIADVEEGYASYEENARKKAFFYASQAGMPALADDSGLEIAYLDGQPGVSSARFIDPAMTFTERNIRILEMMESVDDSLRAARFVCVVALARPDGLVATFQGELQGTIARAMSGAHGFGYDPIFWLPDFGRTLAELEPREKNQISHRARALKAAYATLVALSA
ncbi:MAG: RdgB/HAM1 family non-canonical purine NTP pyrophosphatase [Candidatus Eremiobacteraeota bacterium]|nr:RdgB/HAM1 family non-canonical purine NTP pyrophosphatase [Candidatus Eremiobacteraeota bacterium]